MSVNFALEYRKFEEEQKARRAEYLAAWMNEQQIKAMYDFDKQQLARDLAYMRRTQPLLSSDCGEDDGGDDGKSVLLCKFLDAMSEDENHASGHSRYWWIQEINTQELTKTLNTLSNEDKELLTLYAFDGYGQTENAKKLHVTQSAVSQRLTTVKKKGRL